MWRKYFYFEAFLWIILTWIIIKRESWYFFVSADSYQTGEAIYSYSGHCLLVKCYQGFYRFTATKLEIRIHSCGQRMCWWKLLSLSIRVNRRFCCRTWIILTEVVNIKCSKSHATLAAHARYYIPNIFLFANSHEAQAIFSHFVCRHFCSLQLPADVVFLTCLKKSFFLHHRLFLLGHKFSSFQDLMVCL